MKTKDMLAWRYEFFKHATHFTPAERLSFIMPKIGASSLGALLAKRLRRTDEGLPFFAVGDERIFFLREAEGENEDAAREGALVVLGEAFGGPSDFFSPPVDISEGDVVLDLGGNIGTSALQFARRAAPTGAVYSFEPIFATPLSRTLEASCAGHVEVVPLAVGDRSGEVDFSVTDVGIDSRMAGRATPSATHRVATTTVDDFVEERGLERVDFIKCDIEGAEELAIRGAQATIARFRPKWTISSYHTDPAGDPQHPKLVSLLTDLGYHVRSVGRHHIYAH